MAAEWSLPNRRLTQYPLFSVGRFYEILEGSCGLEDCDLYLSMTAVGSVVAMTKSLKERILAHIVSEIPDELAPCEFDCPMEDCAEDDWKKCGNRLKMVEAIQSHRAKLERIT